MNGLWKSLLISGLLLTAAFTQDGPPPPSRSIIGNFDVLNQKILAMAKDFPEDKYAYQPAPDVRTFGQVIVHIASGNNYAAKAGRGEKAEWTELDSKLYKTKASMIAALQKSYDDASATLKATPADHFKVTISPWMGVIEHAGEHYGQLVVYYRLNGLVPPESRSK